MFFKQSVDSEPLTERSPILSSPRKSEIQRENSVDEVLSIALGQVVQRISKYKLFIQAMLAVSATNTPPDQVVEAIQAVCPTFCDVIAIHQPGGQLIWSITAFDSSSQENLPPSKQWSHKNCDYLVLRTVVTQIDDSNVEQIALQYAKISNEK